MDKPPRTANVHRGLPCQLDLAAAVRQQAHRRAFIRHAHPVEARGIGGSRQFDGAFEGDDAAGSRRVTIQRPGHDACRLPSLVGENTQRARQLRSVSERTGVLVGCVFASSPPWLRRRSGTRPRRVRPHPVRTRQSSALVGQPEPPLPRHRQERRRPAPGLIAFGRQRPIRGR
jgi:hypothetical protein